MSKTVYVDFLNPHSGKVSHLIPGKGRYQQAIAEGWKRLSKPQIQQVRRDVTAGVDTKSSTYKPIPHPYHVKHEGETKFFVTKTEAQAYVESIPKYTVTHDGVETHYRTEEAAQRYADSLPKWYDPSLAIEDRVYYQTETGARASGLKGRLDRLSEITGQVKAGVDEYLEVFEQTEPSYSLEIFDESDPMVETHDLDRQTKEEMRAQEHRELIDRLEEIMASGKERLAGARGLPDPDDFVGIPGPASKPREGSIREKFQEPIDAKLAEMEAGFVDFETKMSAAGKEMGFEFQEAWKEGDYAEATLTGMASASALLGAGVFQDLTFFIRPLAIGKAVKGAGQIIGDVDIESEEAAKKIRENISESEISYATYKLDFDKLMKKYLIDKTKADEILSNKDLYEPESFAKWESNWLDYETQITSLKTSDVGIQSDYQSFLGWRSEAEQIATELELSPRQRVGESVVSAFTTNKGALIQFAGNIFGGYLVSQAFSALTGPQHKLTRLDDVDINVKSTTLKLVDDLDPITGTKFKVAQLPEADITSTISKRKIPKTAFEIMDAELDDLSGTGQILGIADEGGITVLDKIDLPEGALDDLLEGKSVKVDGVIDIETVKIGSEAFDYVDEIADPFTGTKTTISRTGKATPLDAKEIGVTMEITEDASKLSKLELEGDELVTKNPPDVDFDTVKFKSLWDEEGVKGVLDEGKRSYDVKGMLVESTEAIDDLIDEIKPIEPTSGPKTPLSEHFQQPGYTGSLKDISDSLAEDVTIVRELTEGVKPVAKVITEEAKVSPIVSAGIGVGASLASSPFTEERTTITPVKKEEIFDTIVSPMGLISSLEDTGLITDTLEDELGLVDDVIPVIDIYIEPTQKPIPIVIPKITPKPTPKPPSFHPITVTKTVPDVTPIFDVVEIPIQDTPVKPVQKIKPKQDPDLFTPFLSLTGGQFYPRPPKIRIPRKKKKRKGKFEPLIGFEFRSYKYRTTEELIGRSKVKNLFSVKKKKKGKGVKLF